MIMNLLSYLGTFNIPKFFEFELIDSERNGTYFLDYSPTIMNEDKNYITFSSWWDELIVIGILPFFALVAFNSRIYMKLRASDKQEYRFVGHQKLPMEMPTMTITTACVQSSDEDDMSNSCIPPMGDNHNNHRYASPLSSSKQCSGHFASSNSTKPLIPSNGDQILLLHVI